MENLEIEKAMSAEGKTTNDIPESSEESGAVYVA
jgi:hypothetical protein